MISRLRSTYASRSSELICRRPRATHDEANRDELLEEVLPELMWLIRAGPEAPVVRSVFGTLVDLSQTRDRHSRLLQAGVVAPAVALLQATAAAPTVVTPDAAVLLGNLARSEEGRVVITAAGALLPLLTLLRAKPGIAKYAAFALGNLACIDANSTAILEAGVIPLLVPLLQASAKAGNTCCLIRNLASKAKGAFDLHAAGATVPLVALLHDADTLTAERAACALGWIAFYGNDAARRDILTALAARPPPPPSDAKPRLAVVVERMQTLAAACLAAAEAGVDPAALEEAVAQAYALGAPAADLARARSRLTALRAQAEAVQRVRRASLGLDELPTPAEFVCPIMLEVMKDPVVASDGHTYERAAIERVLGWRVLEEQRKSPLTRETLQRSLYPNIALRQRMEAHAADAEALAERVLQAATGAPGARQRGAAPAARIALSRSAPGARSAPQQ